MAADSGPVDVTAELAALKHEMKNQKMKSLPPNTTIKRRPLHHPPVASPHAGSHVQKVVYVSNHTPIMSAVKKVKKLLSSVENRAIQATNPNKHRSRSGFAELVDASERLTKMKEEVLVKASGRAMQQALRIGEWFRTKEKEMMCNVEVRTSSVRAIDDIVEVNEDEGVHDIFEDQKPGIDDSAQKDETTLEGGDTTMELLGGTNASAEEPEKVDAPDHSEDIARQSDHDADASKQPDAEEVTKSKKKKRGKRKRAAYDADSVPEARIRWVKTVEVAISLKA